MKYVRTAHPDKALRPGSANRGRAASTFGAVSYDCIAEGLSRRVFAVQPFQLGPGLRVETLFRRG